MTIERKNLFELTKWHPVDVDRVPGYDSNSEGLNSLFRDPGHTEQIGWVFRKSNQTWYVLGEKPILNPDADITLEGLLEIMSPRERHMASLVLTGLIAPEVKRILRVHHQKRRTPEIEKAVNRTLSDTISAARLMLSSIISETATSLLTGTIEEDLDISVLDSFYDDIDQTPS